MFSSSSDWDNTGCFRVRVNYEYDATFILQTLVVLLSWEIRGVLVLEWVPQASLVIGSMEEVLPL